MSCWPRRTFLSWERGRETDKQTDRQRERERKTEGESKRETERERDRETVRGRGGEREVKKRTPLIMKIPLKRNLAQRCP